MKTHTSDNSPSRRARADHTPEVAGASLDRHAARPGGQAAMQAEKNLGVFLVFFAGFSAGGLFAYVDYLVDESPSFAYFAGSSFGVAVLGLWKLVMYYRRPDQEAIDDHGQRA